MSNNCFFPDKAWPACRLTPSLADGRIHFYAGAQPSKGDAYFAAQKNGFYSVRGCFLGTVGRARVPLDGVKTWPINLPTPSPPHHPRAPSQAWPRPLHTDRVVCRRRCISAPNKFVARARIRPYTQQSLCVCLRARARACVCVCVSVGTLHISWSGGSLLRHSACVSVLPLQPSLAPLPPPARTVVRPLCVCVCVSAAAAIQELRLAWHH